MQGRQSFPEGVRSHPNLVQARARQGGAQMPAFSTDRLPDEALRHILAYIATPTEPEPKPVPEPRVRGVNFEVLEASGSPGERPTVRFRIRDDAGVTIAPSEMSALNLTVAGPTVEYRLAQREDARSAESLPDGSTRYTFRQALPADASGTFAVATEGYIEHAAGVAGPQPVRDTGYNTVFYFGVTDPVPVPRRTVVRTESCNQCHGTLALHGGSRRNTEFCVMCHNVANSDADKRTFVGGPMPPEAILFRNLVHRIHTGEDLTQPFVIYGGNPTNPQPVDLRTVHPFPADRANCNVCHQPGTAFVTGALEGLPPIRIAVDGQVVREIPPVTAACTGCHDSARALIHATTQTISGGAESCAVCHGQGRPFSVSTVHRLVQGPGLP